MSLRQSFSQMSLGRRLLVAAVVWTLIVLIGGGLALSVVYRTQTLQLLDEDLDATLQTLVRAVDVVESGELTYEPRALPADPRYRIPLSGRYWAVIGVDPDDRYQNDELRSDSMWDAEVPLPADLRDAVMVQTGQIHRASLDGPAGEPIRVAAETITITGREEPIILLAGFDRQAADDSAERLTLLMLTAMGLLAAGVLPAMWAGLRVAMRPLDRVEADIADIREGRKSQLDGDYPSEVRELTTELNKLLDHNRGVVERARTHVGNLAHALKTPIAVLKNEAHGETTLDGVVQRQTEAMHASVQHYLKRARAAARAETLGARAELAPLAGGLARMMNKLFVDRGIEVTADGLDGLTVRAEGQDLEEMLGNLMDNACKWARSRVSVTAERAGELVLIHVDDDGPGLSPDERVAALKRGVRLDETAPGTGLGLSIVTELAEMYSGDLILDEAPGLGGLRATLKVRAA